MFQLSLGKLRKEPATRPLD